MPAEANFAWRKGQWCIMIHHKWYIASLVIINNRPVLTFLDPRNVQLKFPLKEIFVC